MRGQIGLHMMASAGAQKLTALVCDHVRDILGVCASQCFAGEQNHTNVNVMRTDFLPRDKRDRLAPPTRERQFL
jgi:hypothetical protein